MNSAVATLSHQVTTLLTRDGVMDALSVSFSYDPADPLVVTLAVSTPETEVHWDFARDSLRDSLTRDVIVGDLVMSADAGAVTFGLNVQHSDLRIECARQGVVAFLEETYEEVPAGAESENMDVESLIEDLLSSSN